MAKRMAIPPDSAQKLARWYDEHLLSDTPVLRSSVFGWLFGLFGQDAVTINKTVHLTDKAPEDLSSQSGIALLGHELYHVVQQHEMGWWGFLLRYLWHWRPKHIKRGEEHPLEEPAYAREREIRSSLSG
jgi:hypothetical protein